MQRLPSQVIDDDFKTELFENFTGINKTKSSMIRHEVKEVSDLMDTNKRNALQNNQMFSKKVSANE